MEHLGSSEPKGEFMSEIENVAAARELYARIERQDWTGVAGLLHPAFIFYPNLGEARPGCDGFVASEKKNFDACPGFQIQVLETVAQENKVGVYLTIEGKVKEELLGVKAPGAHFKFSLFNLLTFDDGLIVEKRAHFDRNFIIRQLEENK